MNMIYLRLHTHTQKKKHTPELAFCNIFTNCNTRRCILVHDLISRKKTIKTCVTFNKSVPCCCFSRYHCRAWLKRGRGSWRTEPDSGPWRCGRTLLWWLQGLHLHCHHGNEGRRPAWDDGHFFLNEFHCVVPCHIVLCFVVCVVLCHVLLWCDRI